MSYWEQARVGINEGIQKLGEAQGSLAEMDSHADSARGHLAGTEEFLRGALGAVASQVSEVESAEGHAGGLMAALDTAVGHLASLGLDLSQAQRYLIHARSELGDANAGANAAAGALSSDNSDNALSHCIAANETSEQAANAFAGATSDSPTPEAYQLHTDIKDCIGTVKSAEDAAGELRTATTTVQGFSDASVQELQQIRGSQKDLLARLAAIILDARTLAEQVAVDAAQSRGFRALTGVALEKHSEALEKTAGLSQTTAQLTYAAAEVMDAAVTVRDRLG